MTTDNKSVCRRQFCIMTLVIFSLSNEQDFFHPQAECLDHSSSPQMSTRKQHHPKAAVLHTRTDSANSVLTQFRPV